MPPASNDATLATLQDDIAKVKHEVASLVAHLKDGAANGTQHAAAHVEAGAQRVYHTLAAEGERTVKAVNQQIERQPLVVMLIALGVGYVGGRFLSR